MRQLIIETPTKLRFDGDFSFEELKPELTFTSRPATFALQRFKKNRWFAGHYGEEAYREKVEELKKAIKVCLLREDDKGYWTYSGLGTYFKERFKYPLINKVTYPEFKLIPYDHTPQYTLRPYQSQGVEKLLEAKHAGVEIGTGLGKSICMEVLCKTMGLQTILMSPTRSIAGQLYRQFVERFGKKYVGMYGDGKKEFNKLFTIGIAASLTRVEKDSDAWKTLSKAKVFIADESHLTPAETLADVCLGLAAQAPYRFFFSGTQLRNDGADMLLDGIVGPIVYHKTVREGVDEGWLAKPKFFMHTVGSPSRIIKKDPIKMNDIHIWKNPQLHILAADLANKSVEVLGHQVLILISHVEQFKFLLPNLRFEVGFAHATLTKDNEIFVDERFRKSNPDELVAKFNAGGLPILIGTDCISLGTDIRPVKTVINLQGGSSEIQLRQSIGRGTRKVEGKDYFNFHDFDIRLDDSLRGEDNSLFSVERHSLIRRKILDRVYGPVTCF